MIKISVLFSPMVKVLIAVAHGQNYYTLGRFYGGDVVMLWTGDYCVATGEASTDLQIFVPLNSSFVNL